MRRARTLMVQGTSSHAGKSLLVTGLCRVFKQDGLRVMPFKSQNMSNNSAVTHEGGEIGRAQWVQAEACGVAPSVMMNPVLIKPKADSRSQVVLMGRPYADFAAREYGPQFAMRRALPEIQKCLDELSAKCDLIMLEGAGSPAEINLREHEIVNMRIAEMADAPVILVGDIDRGGVFAQFVGTLELLTPEERARVKGFIINKFRGDKSLLQPGIEFLERRTNLPVLGVMPYIHAHQIPEEDAVSVEQRQHEVPDWHEPGRIRVAVVRLPRISNFTDFDRLRDEPGLDLYYAQTPRDLGYADMIILPGTKNSVADLTWLKQTGLAEEIRSLRGVVPILGICGGFQMLGKCIHDPEALEGEAGTHEALGLLDVETSFGRAKTTTLSYGEVVTPTELFPQGVTVRGYEIHAGVTTRFGRARAFIKVHLRDGTHVPGGLDDECDGAVNISGDVVGTYFHGLLDNDEMFAAFIESLFSRKALTPVLNRATRGPGGLAARCVAYDRLAQSVREHLDMAEIRRIAGI